MLVAWDARRDYQLNLATERMCFELVGFEEVLRTPWGSWVEGDKIPVTIRPGPSFGSAQ